MEPKIIVQVFTLDSAYQMSAQLPGPLEFTFAEWQTLQDAVRHLRSSRPDWKMKEALQLGPKLGAVSAKVLEHASDDYVMKVAS